MRNWACFILVAVLFNSFSVSTSDAAPTGDTYFGTGIDLVDAYQDAPLTFDGIPQVPNTPYDLSSIRERFQSFPGIAGGVSVTRPNGTTQSVSSWQNAGHVVEFTISSTDGGFISFTPNGLWGVTFSDIDLDASGPTGTPQAVGLYFDFNRNGNNIPYDLDPFSLNSVPIGVGAHPLDGAQQVIYLTDVGVAFDAYQFAATVGKKLQVHLNAEEQFQSFSLEQVCYALGISNNVNLPPYINQFVVGVLVTGLGPDFLAGDYDRDRDVDGHDFLEWQRQFGEVVTPYSGADGNGNGVVDATDYVVWRDNFAAVAGASSGVTYSNIEESVQFSAPSNQSRDSKRRGKKRVSVQG